MIPKFLDTRLSDAPGAIGAYYAAYKTYRWGDPYVRLVASLADKSRAAIDVGAHLGEYTFFMRHYAAACIAYECNPTLTAHLRRRFGTSVDIRADAVSDHATTTQLRIPRSKAGANLGRATIDANNPLTGDFLGVDLVPVRTVRLDDVIDRPVGLLKVDVEGHELAVLRGAAGILARDKPNLILELEDRHAPGCVAAACAFLAPFGYTAAYLRGTTLVPMPAGPAPDAELWNYVFRCRQ